MEESKLSRYEIAMQKSDPKITRIVNSILENIHCDMTERRIRIVVPSYDYTCNLKIRNELIKCGFPRDSLDVYSGDRKKFDDDYYIIVEW